MRKADMDKFVDAIGLVDTCLLGDWKIVFCRKPGRNFADIKMPGITDQFVKRTGIIHKLEESKAKIKRISGRRWRAYFPTDLVARTLRISLLEKYGENVEPKEYPIIAMSSRLGSHLPGVF